MKSVGAWWVGSLISLSLFLYPAELFAGQFWAGGKVTTVHVSSHTSGPNPGLTCFQMDQMLETACTNGFIAVPENDPGIISALLAAKAANENVLIYYFDDVSNLHCPGQVLTGCRVNTVGIVEPN